MTEMFPFENCHNLHTQMAEKMFKKAKQIFEKAKNCSKGKKTLEKANQNI